MKKNLLTILIIISFCSVLKAQQNEHYSHYIFNKLLLNPAYAGSKDYLSVDLLYRTQWTKIEGSPNTFTLALHGPLKNKSHALGGSISFDAIGPYKNLQVVLDYAYRIKTKKGNFSIGINGGIFSFFTDYSSLDAYQSGNDDAYTNLTNSSILPVVGFGIYHQTKKLSWGISSPYLLNGAVSFTKNKDVITLRNYYFGFAEYLQKLSPKFQLKPSVIIKLNHGAPANLDANLHLIYNDLLMVGFGYRTENSFIFSAQYILNDFIKKQNPYQFRIGYAFDLSNNKIRSASGGTHEIILGFDFVRKPEKIKSPRFF